MLNTLLTASIQMSNYLHFEMVANNRTVRWTEFVSKRGGVYLINRWVNSKYKKKKLADISLYNLFEFNSFLFAFVCVKLLLEYMSSICTRSVQGELIHFGNLLRCDLVCTFTKQRSGLLFQEEQKLWNYSVVTSFKGALLQ